MTFLSVALGDECKNNERIRRHHRYLCVGFDSRPRYKLIENLSFFSKSKAREKIITILDLQFARRRKRVAGTCRDFSPSSRTKFLSTITPPEKERRSTATILRWNITSVGSWTSRFTGPEPVPWGNFSFPYIRGFREIPLNFPMVFFLIAEAAPELPPTKGLCQAAPVPSPTFNILLTPCSRKTILLSKSITNIILGVSRNGNASASVNLRK